MTSPDEEREPSPEQFAAYLDGEHEHLGGLPPDQIERWLRGHPEAAEQARAQRRLARLWHKTTPDEPVPAAWRRVRAGIERGLDRPARPRRLPWRGWSLAAGLFVTAAACVTLAVVAMRRPAPEAVPGPAVSPPTPVAVLPVVSDDEVEILSVRGEDVSSLVVGALPLQGLLVLADPGEVTLIRSCPCGDDRTMPVVRMNGEETPMVWAPAPAEAKQTPNTP